MQSPLSSCGFSRRPSVGLLPAPSPVSMMAAPSAHLQLHQAAGRAGETLTTPSSVLLCSTTRDRSFDGKSMAGGGEIALRALVHTAIVGSSTPSDTSSLCICICLQPLPRQHFCIHSAHIKSRSISLFSFLFLNLTPPIDLLHYSYFTMESELFSFLVGGGKCSSTGKVEGSLLFLFFCKSTVIVPSKSP